MCPDKIETELISPSVAVLEKHQTIFEQMTSTCCIDDVQSLVEPPLQGELIVCTLHEVPSKEYYCFNHNR